MAGGIVDPNSGLDTLVTPTGERVSGLQTVVRDASTLANLYFQFRGAGESATVASTSPIPVVKPAAIGTAPSEDKTLLYVGLAIIAILLLK